MAPAQTSDATTPLHGVVVVLDPGHNGGNAAAASIINRLVPAGGFDKPCDTTGTQTDAAYPEYAFTLDVAERTMALLKAAGATVVMTRSDSSGVGPCVNVRAAIGNGAHAAAAVSIHADGGPVGVPGFHVLEPGLAPDHGNAAILTSSARLAQDLFGDFAAATGEPVASYEAPGIRIRTDLGGLNLSQVPKVFIECANMRDASDAARVTNPAWRQLAAQGIANGIIQFLQNQ